MSNNKTINQKELETLKYWEENQIFEKSVSNPAGLPNGVAPTFTFYDGPPFATGMPHHGSLMAGTVKDLIPRYKTMQGYTVRRVWGWDCHGLPIENLIEKELSLNSKKEIEEYGIGKFTNACSESVLRYDHEWKNIIPRMGRWVDMQNAYKTMDATYTESIWWAWKELWNKGLAYEGYKIMHICPRCETPLAQSEVGLEYHDITDMSVTAEFELADMKYENSPIYVLAWTTTPWTLPGNTALAINRNIEYVIIESKIEEIVKYFIVAKSKAENVFAKSQSFKIVKDINAEELIGLKYKPVFNTFNNEEYLSKLENVENIWKIWHADFINDESGTGVAHEAPAFGADDMELAKLNNIPVIKHVLMNGHFVAEVENDVPEFAGLVVKKKDDSISTDIEVVKWLAHNGKLFSKEKIIHSYPLCWRCKTPLLNYATSSWFVDIPKIRGRLIEENSKTSWVPAHIKDGRFGKWLEGAREWAVSRRRYWGAPLPIWKSVDGSEMAVLGSLDELASRQTVNNKYFIARHGQANSNVTKTIDSKMDESNVLTQIGIEQAEKDRDNLNGKIDLIIASPFQRTKQTAEIISANQVEVIYDDRLGESRLGVWDGKTIEEFQKWFTNTNITFMERRPEGGETHREMMRRVASVLLECESKYKDRKILFVTHAGPANMILSFAHHLSDTQIQNNLFDLNSPYYLKAGEAKEFEFKKVCYDENLNINLHRPYIDSVILKDSKGGDMRLIGDVFDCWFESGSMPFASLHYPFENKDTFQKNFPAHFIAESMDQTRGWFYSLINLGVGLFDKTPFIHVNCNGIINAADGKKISKSDRNYTDPMLLVEKYGADAFRFYLMACPVVKGESINFSDADLEEVYKKNILRFENVLEFYNTNKIENVNASAESKDVLDKWILTRLAELINGSIKGYEAFKLDEAVNGIGSFVDDLSTWYLRRSRDKLKDGNLETLETMKYVLIEFAKTVAPIMPFLAERVYQEVANTNDSVHLTKYPSSGEVDSGLIDEMRLVRSTVADALMLRQKSNLPVRQPLNKITFNKNIPEKYFDIIKDELNIKQIEINESAESISLDIELTPVLIYEGKQRELSREIKDLRKELGLTPADSINVVIESERFELVNDSYKSVMKIVNLSEGEKLQISKA